jgi:plasmid stabilization system protein ParE
MRLPLILRPEAEEDLRVARDWYAGRRLGLGEEFLEAATEALERVRENPARYAVESVGVRRCKLRRFPYVVYYRLLSDRVEVLGILHGHGDPGKWQSRS